MSRDQSKAFNLDLSKFDTYTPPKIEEEKKSKTQEDKIFNLGITPENKMNPQKTLKNLIRKASDKPNSTENQDNEIGFKESQISHIEGLKNIKKSENTRKTEHQQSKSFPFSINECFDTFESDSAQKAKSNESLQNKDSKSLGPKSEPKDNKLNESFQNKDSKSSDPKSEPQEEKPNRVFKYQDSKCSDANLEDKDNKSNQFLQNKDSKSSVQKSEPKERNPYEVNIKKNSKSSVPKSEPIEKKPNEEIKNKDLKSLDQRLEPKDNKSKPNEVQDSKSSEHKDNKSKPNEVKDSKSSEPKDNKIKPSSNQDDSKSKDSESDGHIENAPFQLTESMIQQLESYDDSTHATFFNFLLDMSESIYNIVSIKRQLESYDDSAHATFHKLIEEIVYNIEKAKFLADSHTKEVFEFMYNFHIESSNYPILLSQFELFDSNLYENKKEIISEVFNQIRIESIMNLDKTYYELAVKYLIANIKEMYYENIFVMLEKEKETRISINEGIIDEINEYNGKILDIAEGISPFEYSRTLMLNINRVNETNEMIGDIEEMIRSSHQGFDFSSINNFIDLKF